MVEVGVGPDDGFDLVQGEGRGEDFGHGGGRREGPVEGGEVGDERGREVLPVFADAKAEEEGAVRCGGMALDEKGEAGAAR